MKDKKQVKEIVGFDFQVISLEEAKPLVLAGEGNYADLKAKVMETLPTLDANQAFSFGLPSKNGEVPEDQRRGICFALNKTLSRAGFAYKVTYTSIKKLFLVMPKEQKIPKPVKVRNFKGDNAELQEKIKKLRLQNIPPRKIIELTGATKAMVSYVLYQKMKDEEMIATPTIKHENVFASLAEDTFNSKVDQFTKKQHKAFCVVGYKDLKLNPARLGEIAGLTAKGIRYTATYVSNKADAEIAALRKTIKNGGTGK